MRAFKFYIIAFLVIFGRKPGTRTSCGEGLQGARMREREPGTGAARLVEQRGAHVHECEPGTRSSSPRHHRET